MKICTVLACCSWALKKKGSARVLVMAKMIVDVMILLKKIVGVIKKRKIIALLIRVRRLLICCMGLTKM